MTDVLDRTAAQARLDFVAAEGRRWQQVHAEAFAKLTPGTTVIIDIATGDYVVGTDWHEARQLFRERFPKPGRTSFSFDVDRPLFVGGGLRRKS
jgi:hypothetical protein